MIIVNDKTEIKTVISDVEWNGAKDKCCRSLNFKFLFNNLKADIPFYNIAAGDKVEWIEDKSLFTGYVEKITYSTSEDVINISCQDFAARLMKSKCVGRFAGTLNQIADNICGLFNLKNGINKESTIKHNIVSKGDLTYFEVLKTALDSAFGKDTFNFYMDGITLKIAEKEIQNTFIVGKNIREMQFEQSIENLITSVIVLGDKDVVIGKPKQNDANLKQFGLFQTVYNWKKDSKDNYEQIESLLKSPNNDATFICNNDNNCISGRYIKIINNNTEGVFEIITDSHTINADSQMTLKVRQVG